MSKKIISILLTVVLAVSLVTFALVNTSAAVDENGRYVPSSTITNTQRLYFYMPSDWYVDGFDVKDAGAYWWGGDDACSAVDGSEGAKAWPGYKMQVADEDLHLFYIDFPNDNPDNMTPVVFNNFLDGGEAQKDEATGEIVYVKGEAAYKAAKQTTDIPAAYYSEGDNDFYDELCDGEFFTLANEAVNGDDKTFLGDFADNFFIHPDWDISMNFNNMVYVIDPQKTSENFQGKQTFVGEWYFYYGDGEYGPLPNKDMAEEQGLVKALSEPPVDPDVTTTPVDPSATQSTTNVTTPVVTTSPTQTDAPTTTIPPKSTDPTSKASTIDSATKDNADTNGAVQTGAVSVAVIVFALLAVAAGAVVFTRKRFE